jgi:hypothetical protein
MSMMKLLSPDFATGKLLVTIRSVFEIGTMLVARPSVESLYLARLIMQGVYFQKPA